MCSVLMWCDTTAATSKTPTCGSLWNTAEPDRCPTSSGYATRRYCDIQTLSVTALRCVFSYVCTERWARRSVCVCVCACLAANGRGDSHHPAVHPEGSGVSSLHEENPQRHQSRQHPAEHRGSGQTGRLRSCWTAHREWNCLVFRTVRGEIRRSNKKGQQLKDASHVVDDEPEGIVRRN